ncbi:MULTISPECIES: cell wall metabolism sensor histidine kinase WalK [unclassified Nostoc]|uniref:sensor histidine kinase n=1 Tax=unclassified Nostoc TaxID=2593658 RepID=UPI001C896B68|nr:MULTISPECIES: HAMP domain-containing sensor histidine kinase [unclassified Nostoc]
MAVSQAINQLVAQTNQSPKWYRLFFGVRTRILVCYVLLMAFSAVVSIAVIRQVLFVRLQQRIEKSLEQEIDEFRLLTQTSNPQKSQLSEDEIASIFKIYLNRNIPDDDEFMITLINGQYYKSSPRALPSYLKNDSYPINYWAEMTMPQYGHITTRKHTIIYRAEPITRGDTHGVFVVAQSPAGEYHEIDEAVMVIIEVSFLVLGVASLLGWVVVGRLLIPLRLLTETARSISESDWKRSIPVTGSDEIAELTITFNEMLERLQAAFATQRDFINDAGHELRTPITIIRGHLELLGDDPQERQETIELVTDELDRMSRFVNDLLLLAKAEQPNFLNLKTVEIGLLTEELYAKAKALAERDWRLEAIASGLIVADRQRLTQAIMNLAQNATQHTNDGSMIALGSLITNGKVRFWVRDTGAGIAPSDQKRIFQRFARGCCGRRSEGAGLGLAIVQAIAEAHGGKIELFSRPLGGSTFTLVIPLKLEQEILSHEPDFNRRRRTSHQQLSGKRS